ncbi:MAG: hypothetical protein O2967_17595 [Proteobacteria bacterium]|nr:hypothetical protein [Pseudomonadota bacterium]
MAENIKTAQDHEAEGITQQDKQAIKTIDEEHGDDWYRQRPRQGRGLNAAIVVGNEENQGYEMQQRSQADLALGFGPAQ